MSTLRLAIAAVVALALLQSHVPASAPARKPVAPKKAGAERQIGNLRFKVPAGWEYSEKDRIGVLTIPAVSPTQCVVMITPEADLDQDFLKWFRGKWDALRKDAKIIKGGELTADEGPSGSDVIYEAALLEDGTKQFGLLLYAIRRDDGVQWIVFRTQGAALFNEHKPAVTKFLGGLRLVDGPHGTGGGATPEDDEGGEPKEPTRRR